MRATKKQTIHDQLYALRNTTVLFYAHSREQDVEIQVLGVLRETASGWMIGECSFPVSAVIDVVPDDVVLNRPVIVEVRI